MSQPACRQGQTRRLSSMPKDLSADFSDLIFNTSIAALNSTERRTRVAWCRLQLCLVVSSNLDCLRQSTRGRISLGSQTDLLESQEIHECRNRLHNVVCWSFVATLHEGGTGGTMQEVLSGCLCHRDGSGRSSFFFLTNEEDHVS